MARVDLESPPAFDAAGPSRLRNRFPLNDHARLLQATAHIQAAAQISKSDLRNKHDSVELSEKFSEEALKRSESD